MPPYFRDVETLTPFFNRIQKYSEMAAAEMTKSKNGNPTCSTILSDATQMAMQITVETEEA
ncbi:MAG: hypothetical protein R3B53_01215 [Candidatus Paceibacterota bacterium]